LDTPALGLIEVFQQLMQLDYGTFVPVKDRGIDVVGFNPKKGRFIALQVKSSSRHEQRYASKGGEYGYWWEIPISKHSEIKGQDVYYIFVGLHFDLKNRSVIDKDFFIIDSLELQGLIGNGAKINRKRNVVRLEIIYDTTTRKFVSPHDPLADFTTYHNDWKRLK
jgi:hypothetical protein